MRYARACASVATTGCRTGWRHAACRHAAAHTGRSSVAAVIHGLSEETRQRLVDYWIPDQTDRFRARMEARGTYDPHGVISNMFVELADQIMNKTLPTK